MKAGKSKKAGGAAVAPKREAVAPVDPSVNYGLDDDCPICLSSLVEPRRLSCGHHLCMMCLNELRKYRFVVLFLVEMLRYLEGLAVGGKGVTRRMPESLTMPRIIHPPNGSQPLQ